MANIDYLNDVTGTKEQAHGSDKRLNVSSRIDDRIYYNSRDESEAYSVIFNDAGATSADYLFYMRNTNTNGKHLVVNAVGLNSEVAATKFELLIVTVTTGTDPTGGATLTPTCLNRAAPKSAAVAAFAPVDSNTTPMINITDGVELDHVGIGAIHGHEELRLNGTLRLGQDVALSIKLSTLPTVTDKNVYGVVFFYFE